ncbi:hypothetical protein VTJ04DRAFT_10388 [Mycothermus thermophilus]|uniref:uncharacterized protein n=1 Tax=Humicola insolens TaxID=85995 RepID=UPI0037449D4D
MRHVEQVEQGSPPNAGQPTDHLEIANKDNGASSYVSIPRETLEKITQGLVQVKDILSNAGVRLSNAMDEDLRQMKATLAQTVPTVMAGLNLNDAASMSQTFQAFGQIFATVDHLIQGNSAKQKYLDETVVEISTIQDALESLTQVPRNPHAQTVSAQVTSEEHLRSVAPQQAATEPGQEGMQNNGASKRPATGDSPRLHKKARQ